METLERLAYLQNKSTELHMFKTASLELLRIIRHIGPNVHKEHMSTMVLAMIAVIGREQSHIKTEIDSITRPRA